MNGAKAREPPSTPVTAHAANQRPFSGRYRLNREPGVFHKHHPGKFRFGFYLCERNRSWKWANGGNVDAMPFTGRVG
jgi:hypothetical protein